MNYFNSNVELIDYILSEILATLKYDLECMEGRESEHYDDDDRECIRQKILEIEVFYESNTDIINTAFNHKDELELFLALGVK